MQKLIIIIITLLLYSSIGISQNDVIISFNSTYTGRSVSITASKILKEQNEFGGGLRYNINSLAHPDDQNNIFKKRLYATKPIHYFGLQGYYHRYILNKWKHLRPFLFYDLQVTYSTTRTRMLLPFSYDVNGDVLYKEYIEFFGPFTWIEQSIGVGFKANLFSNWYFQQKIGVGSSFILGYDKKLLGKYFEWFDWDFCYLLNVGIGYRF